jgi:hypothetical protein
LKEYDAKLAALLADPRLHFLSHAGIEDRDRTFYAERHAAIDKLAADLSARLDKAAAQIESEGDAALTFEVTRDDRAEALQLMEVLEKVGPAHGITLAVEFLNDGNKAAIYELLPMLRSLFDREGSTWTRNESLLRVIRGAEALLSNPVATQLFQARRERIERARWEIAQLVAAAKDRDAAARKQVFEMKDGDGKLAYLPDEPVVPRPESIWPLRRGAKRRSISQTRRLKSSNMPPIPEEE